MTETTRIVNIRKFGWGEYRVPSPGGGELAAYYTSDEDDAIGTAKLMWHPTPIETKIVPYRGDR